MPATPTQDNTRQVDDEDPLLLLTQDGHVATITINRAQQHNVWSPSMGPLLERLVQQCEVDSTVRVIVLTGAGRMFCGGADVAALQAALRAGASPQPFRARNDDDFDQRFTWLLGIAKPIVCALNGPAVGIGAVLAMFCDIRWAAPSARIATAFVRRGLAAEHGIAWILPRLIGTSRAIELLLSGRTIDAEESERLGLVSAVLPQEGFADEVARRAAELATLVSPRAAAIIKRQVYVGLTQPLAQAVHQAEDEVPGCIASEDFREGIEHFLEKRPPRFTGR